MGGSDISHHEDGDGMGQIALLAPRNTEQNVPRTEITHSQELIIGRDRICIGLDES